MRQFLRIVRVLPGDEDLAGLPAEIRSLSAGATLVTNNTSHFQRIHGPLILLNWRVL